MTKILRRPVLALGLAVAMGATVAAAPAAYAAHARVLPPVPDRRVAVAWGNGNSTPAQVPQLAAVKQVSAGALHSLTLRTDGTVWGWGNNWFGQLGDGTFTSRSTPVQVTGLNGVVQVSAGGLFSLALRSDGTVWAWGAGNFGQLGDGSLTSRSTPVEVTGLDGVTRISAGGQFALALRADGTVWAWGRNQVGQLGNGTTADSAVPVKVTGLAQVRSISAGFDASLATRTRGFIAVQSLWAWGGNSAGQLGDRTFRDHVSPEQVTGVSVPFFASISAGYQFAVVAGTDGGVWGWGTDGFGQLGNGPHGPANRPEQITGRGSGITQLSAGYRHVLALMSSGTVLAWGDNSQGELGNGSAPSVSGPVQVVGLSAVSQVSAGGFYSLAVHVAPWVSRTAS